jgi:hypothetical protein
MTKRCYFDNTECDCDAFDTVGECPRDDLAHDEFMDEDSIEEAYYAQPRGHDDEIERF